MKHLLIACVAVAALAVPGAAMTAHSTKTGNTYTVFLGEQGPPPAAIMKLKLFGAINQFMPSKLVIAAGDSVTFSSGSFHTVTYAPKPMPLFVPDPAKGTYAGLKDAAGSPFYFDTLGKFIYNGPAFAPFGPKTISGKTPVSSGGLSPQGPKSPPATATYAFPTAGSYKLFCTLHPGMKATVVVKPAGSAVPKTPDQVKAQALLQMSKGFEQGIALAKSTKPAGPNTVVMGVGGKFFYGPGRNDRESDDGVFVTFEFPGPKHPKAGKGGTDESDIVVVTYSSFNTNSFESYGECLMGSRGTMIVEEEREVYLFKENEPGKARSGGRDTNVTVTGADAKKPVLEASSTWGGAGSAVTKQANAPRWDSNVRGYRSEMEHFAYCVRKWDPKLGYQQKDGQYEQELPRCHGEVAMADAILALTANMAMDKRVRIEFDPKWFQADAPDVPETKYGKNGIA